jgi:hypothetical protein
MITVDEAKAHCRIDDNQSDTELAAMIAAAEAHVENYLNVLPDPVPAPVKAAALLLVADLYEHREAQSEMALYANRAFFQLLNPYRAMAV